jgi:hypothetical protein
MALGINILAIHQSDASLKDIIPPQGAGQSPEKQLAAAGA